MKAGKRLGAGDAQRHRAIEDAFGIDGDRRPPPRTARAAAVERDVRCRARRAAPACRRGRRASARGGTESSADGGAVDGGSVVARRVNAEIGERERRHWCRHPRPAAACRSRAAAVTLLPAAGRRARRRDSAASKVDVARAVHADADVSAASLPADLRRPRNERRVDARRRRHARSAAVIGAKTETPPRHAGKARACVSVARSATAVAAQVTRSAKGKPTTSRSRQSTSMPCSRDLREDVAAPCRRPRRRARTSRRSRRARG